MISSFSDQQFNNLPGHTIWVISWLCNSFQPSWVAHLGTFRTVVIYLFKLKMCGRRFLHTLRLAYLLKSVNLLSCLAVMILAVRKKGNTLKHAHSTTIKPFRLCHTLNGIRQATSLTLWKHISAGIISDIAKCVDLRRFMIPEVAFTHVLNTALLNRRRDI